MSFPDVQLYAFQIMMLWSVLVFAVTLAAITIGRKQTGPPRHVARGGRGMRLGVVLLCSAVAALLLLSETRDAVPALFALGFAALTAWLAPGLEDMVLGRDGVRRGWQARNFAQLEGWRLEGQHLRFLVHGELVAVEVPPDQMESVERILLSACPDQQNTLGLVRPGDAPQS